MTLLEAKADNENVLNKEVDVNFIHIAGHLGADPETRFTSTGRKVTTLRVAARTRKGQTEDTIWWRVTIWGEQYDKMLPYLKKGSPIVVAGEIHKPEMFNDREGKPQISMDMTASHVQFSPFGRSGGGAAGEGGMQQAGSPSSGGHASAPFGTHPEGGAPTSPYVLGASPMPAKGDVIDDEVPF